MNFAALRLIPLFLIASASVVSASSRPADDEDIDRVYRIASQAYASLDGSQLPSIYAPAAAYLSRSPKSGIDKGDTVIQAQTGFLKRLRDNGGEAQLTFRVTERKILGDVVVDNGYMRFAFRPEPAAEQQVAFAKFITVMTRGDDRQWRFVSDADVEAPGALYEQATPLPDAQFDP